MKIDLTEKQFRRLLDLVYVGNWVMNSTRGDDRIREYDDVESTVFANCLSHGMVPLVEAYQGELIPSRAFAEGGIHEAIMAYEDTMFFEILAPERAHARKCRRAARAYGHVLRRIRAARHRQHHR